MSKVALVVEFQVKPNYRDQFLTIIREHAAGTSREEEGCLQFDVLLPHEGGNRVFLYEVYRDDAAFQIHGKSPRLQQTRSRYADMIDNRTITRCDIA